MTVDNGNRITFNNNAVHGTKTTLSVNQKEALQFSVFPNPFSDIVNVVGVNQTENVSYKLFTIDGKLIKNGKTESSKVDLNDISKGVYLLQLSFDGKIETKKIIKK